MDIDKIIRAAEQQGWEVTTTRKNHILFVAPSGARKPFSGTPSDVKAIRNHLAWMKRQGFIWPWSKQAQREHRRRKDQP